RDLDANEEVLPDTGREETLLPFRAREVLGLPTYLDRDRLVSYYFDCLLGGAGEVHLFFVENDKTEKSRFVEKLLWERQKKEKATDMKRYIRPVQYQVTLVNRDPAPVPKSGEMVSFLRGFTYSATALNVYLRCPLRFYYSFVLGLSRRKEITGEIERADLGTFVHAVLKTYFSHKRGRVLKAQEIDPGGMDRLVEDLFEKEYGRDVSGAAYLMKRQIKRHMADFLKEYYAPLVRRSRVTIAGVEVSLGARIGPFALKGRLDSIEERDGKTVIVDFKTGAQANPLKIDIEALDLRRRETWGRAIGSLQLPFYVLLYSEKKRLPVTDLNALFLLLGRSRIDEKLELPLFDPASPGDAYEPAKTVIFTLLQEITDPSVPFSASTDRKRACPSCDFPYFCGTQWIVK
ncbi:MAG: PD-(D/E)XK nuclease family protein, partial [Nitrospirae bacterium]|nr:PD-(D/E)XK nuclease family protein [Nitrospirota bacterium]